MFAFAAAADEVVAAVVVEDDLLNREDAPVVVVCDLVGDVAVTEAVLVKARRDDVNTRRSIIEVTKNFPDDSTNSGVEVYFSMSGYTVS